LPTLKSATASSIIKWKNAPPAKARSKWVSGLAGGGMGVYGYCEKCERVVWKCDTGE